MLAPWCSLGPEVAQLPASPARVSVVWSSRLAHRVIRRHRRPLRGLRGGARIGLFRNPMHRLSRCFTLGTLAGARRKVVPHRSALPFGRAPRPVPPSFLSWFFRPFVGPLSRVSPIASGSHRTASVPDRPFGPPSRTRCGFSPHPVGERTALCSASAGRYHPPCSFRPRGWFHLDGLLRDRPPACCSWCRVWGSRGWFRAVRRCSARLLSESVGPPRAGSGRTLAFSLRRFGSRLAAGGHHCLASPLLSFLPRPRRIAPVRGSASSSDRSESSAASCHRSPGGPRFDPHVPSSPKRIGFVGGACIPVFVARGVSSTRSGHSGGSSIRASSGRSVGDLAGAAFTGCPVSVGRQDRGGRSPVFPRSGRHLAVSSVPWGVGMWTSAPRFAHDREVSFPPGPKRSVFTGSLQEPLRSGALRVLLPSLRAAGCPESPPAQRVLEGGLDLRGRCFRCSSRISRLGPIGGTRSTRHFDGSRVRDGASNHRPVTFAPSPPPGCFRSAAAGFRGLFHRRVQRSLPRCVATVDDAVPSLGLFPLPGLPREPVLLCSRRSSAGVDQRSLAGPSRCRSPRRSRLLRIAPSILRTMARHRLFDSRGRSRTRRCSTVPAWGFLTSKSDCHDIRSSWQGPVKNSEIGRAHV